MQKISKKSYKVKPSELNYFHIRGTMRLHNPLKKDYDEHYHLLKIEPKAYPHWDKHKEILGFDDFEILHQPDEKPMVEYFDVKFGGDTHKMTLADMKKILDDNKESYQKNIGAKKLVEMVERVGMALAKKPAEGDLS